MTNARTKFEDVVGVLLREVILWHSDENDCGGLGSTEGDCDWCFRAKAALLRTPAGEDDGR
jgi:hypothetical protein